MGSNNSHGEEALAQSPSFFPTKATWKSLLIYSFPLHDCLVYTLVG